MNIKPFLVGTLFVFTMIIGIGLANGSILGMFPKTVGYIGYAIAFSSFALFWAGIYMVSED